MNEKNLSDVTPIWYAVAFLGIILMLGALYMIYRRPLQNPVNYVWAQFTLFLGAALVVICIFLSFIEPQIRSRAKTQ